MGSSICSVSRSTNRGVVARQKVGMNMNRASEFKQNHIKTTMNLTSFRANNPHSWRVPTRGHYMRSRKRSCRKRTRVAKTPATAQTISRPIGSIMVAAISARDDIRVSSSTAEHRSKWRRPEGVEITFFVFPTGQPQEPQYVPSIPGRKNSSRLRKNRLKAVGSFLRCDE